MILEPIARHLCQLALAVMLALCAAGQAAAASVVWYVFNLPPFYITEGPRKGEGFLDLALRRQLLPGLGQHAHKVEVLPLARVDLQMTLQPNACVLGMLKSPERERSMAFSEPFMAFLPPGVLVRTGDVKHLARHISADGKLSFKQVLAEQALSVGVSSGRSYGAVIDALLAPHRGSSKLFVNATSAPASSLLQMQMLGRVDIVPGFPHELRHLADGDRAMLDGLRFLRLQEQPDVVHGRVSCAKGPQGAAMLRDAYAVLSRPEVHDALAAYYSSWLDEPSRAIMRKFGMR